MDEARHFKYGVQIDVGKYYCIHDRSPVRELSSGSCDLFNFGKINYILEMVQDRDIVMVED